MREDHRNNKYTVSLIPDVDQLSAYINKCALDATDMEILKRVHLRHQSHVEISMDLHISVETVGRRYNKALAVLAAVARKCMTVL